MLSSPDAFTTLMKRATLPVLLVTFFLGLIVVSCGPGTSPATPVSGFDSTRYLGTWYEIARLPHRFERGLTDVTARYSKNDDGTIKVVNRGWSASEDEWKESNGKARFTQTPDIGQLEVSFFGPFYGLYTVAELDPNYGWAMVVGPGTDYFWILSRTPELDESIVERLIARAGELGIDTSKIERVSQERAR